MRMPRTAAARGAKMMKKMMMTMNGRHDLRSSRLSMAVDVVVHKRRVGKCHDLIVVPAVRAHRESDLQRDDHLTNTTNVAPNHVIHTQAHENPPR